MTIIRWVCALALALLLPCALQAQIANQITMPGGWAPMTSPCVRQANGTCVPVSADNPLPITGGSGGGGGGAVTQSGTWVVNLGTIGGAATAAKQDAIQAVLDVMNIRIGNTTSPAAGSMNWYLAAIKTAAEDPNPVAIAQRPAKTNALTSVSAATGSTLLLAVNDNRIGCSVANNSSAILYISQSSGVSSTSYQWSIDAKTTVAGTFLCPPGWTGAVYGAWASATGNALVGEWAP